MNRLVVPPYDWDEALRQAVALVDDIDRYQAIARDAFAYAQLNYGSDKHADTIVGAVFGSATTVAREERAHALAGVEI